MIRFLTMVCCLATAGVAHAGRIDGKIHLSGQAPDRPGRSSPESDPACGKEPIVDKESVVEETEGLLPYTAVVLEPKRKNEIQSTLPTTVEMDQSGCEFLPFVLVAAPGATLKVSNSDRTLHNVHLKKDRQTLKNMAQPQGRPPLEVVLEAEGDGPIRIDCDVHYWMRGWVYVSSATFGTVTDESGQFWFDPIPPGKYTLTAWHPGWGTVRQQIHVKPTGTTELVVELPEPKKK